MDLPPNAVEAINNGKKITAIKCVREVYGIGLKEAKDVVDDYIEKTPGLAQNYQKNLSQFTGLLTISIIVVVVMITIASLHYS